MTQLEPSSARDLVMSDVALWAPASPAVGSAAVEWVAQRVQVEQGDGRDESRRAIEAAVVLLCYLRGRYPDSATMPVPQRRAYRRVLIDVFLVLVEEWESR